VTSAPDKSSPLLAVYPPVPLELERAEGCELIATDGKRYLDLYGGHCVCILGHNPAVLRDAIVKQMERITFYSTALALPERDAAARALLAISPGGFDRVFFVNSGAEANENALKFACAATGRSVVVAVEGAFHGRTAATDSVTGDAKRKIHWPRAPFTVRWVPFGDAGAVERALAADDVAAVILEPVQSTAGCRVHPKDVVAAINEHAPRHGALVVADEVQGGFGRCIEMWSHEAIGLRADLFTAAKGLGAGFPVGALVVRAGLAEPKGYFGSTFGGGPLAAAAVRVVCAEISKSAFRANVRAASAVVDGIAGLPGVAGLQGIGLLRGIRLGPHAKAVKDALHARGIVVSGSHDPEVLRLLPPLTLSVEQAWLLVSTLREILAELHTVPREAVPAATTRKESSLAAVH
jgi:acetylornithine/N-succinyldiaminopimelate aminotransferase